MGGKFELSVFIVEIMLQGVVGWERGASVDFGCCTLGVYLKSVL